MVKCQSANQLKTPAKVSWAFKMVSQFGSLGYTIMGKTADLTVVQKTIIDTLHKEGKPQTFIAKEAGCSQSTVSKHVNRVEWKDKVWKKKMHNQPREPQPYEDCQTKSILEFGWTSQVMDWGWGQGIKSHHTQTCHLATVVVRGVLPGLRRRRTGLLPSGPKSSFQMRASFVFHLETKVLESGGRVEKLIAQVAWSPVLSFHSVMIWGPMSSAGVGPLCFFKPNVTAPVYQDILEHFMLPSADQLFKDADFTLPKAPKDG